MLLTTGGCNKRLDSLSTTAKTALQDDRPTVFIENDDALSLVNPSRASLDFSVPCMGCVRNLMANAGVLLVLMVATLVLRFSSFRMAGIIGAIAVLSAGPGMGALRLFGHLFGFMAIVGAIGLIGVAINDSIVVLAAIRESEAARAGNRQAVLDVVMRSTRHVLATLRFSRCISLLRLTCWRCVRSKGRQRELRCCGQWRPCRVLARRDSIGVAALGGDSLSRDGLRGIALIAGLPIQPVLQ